MITGIKSSLFHRMTEDLRRQTQERIDKGVVQRRENERHKSVTNIEQDLSTQSDLQLKSLVSYEDRSIWVIKNKTVLENLIKWLDFQRKKQEKIN